MAIPDSGLIAVAVGRLMARDKPDLSIHLGDVYYAGTPEEELAKFTACGRQAAWARSR